MFNMKKALGFCVASMLMASPAMAEKPKYIFYMVGDGLGASQRQFADFFLQEQSGDASKTLLMNKLSVAGMNTTYSADSLITDSAAAGTSLASGVKTNNAYIGKDIDGKDVTSLTREAIKAGMGTGLVTTTRMTHATPAAFASNNISRNNENEIAEDYLASGVDFFAGGGIRHFVPQGTVVENGDMLGKTIKSSRKDDRNLVSEFEEKGYKTFIGKDGVESFSNGGVKSGDKVLALFTHTHFPYEIERINKYQHTPSLADMTSVAIDALKDNDNGFFLMVEGGRIDHAAHANDAPATIYDTIAFDHSIQMAYDFYKQNPEDTLIVVVGDHETGGLGLGMDKKGYRMDMSALLDTKVSIEDSINAGPGAYTGNRAEFLAYLDKEFGLGNLTKEEAATLNKAMDSADAGQTMGYYDLNPAALTAAYILSERANIHWTTTIHTATMIPLSAEGAGAEMFSGFKDNAEIAQAMAELLGFNLNN